jgi:antitoxin MazE
VELSITEGRLVITPAPSPAYSLAELVAGITPENRHEETDWGKPVGGEVW